MANKTVLFLMMPEWGNFMPGCALATKLAKHGWDSLFMLPSEGAWAPEVTAVNSHQVSKYQEHFKKKGLRVEFFRAPPAPASMSEKNIAKARKKIVEHALDDAKNVIEKHNVDLVFVDYLLPFMAIPSVESNVPFIGISANLASYATTDVPPIDARTFRQKSRFNIINKFINFGLWTAYGATAFCSGRLTKRGFIQHIWGPRHAIHKRAKKAGLKEKLAGFGSRLYLPEITYICSSSFDLDLAKNKSNFFWGNIIDFERNDAPLTLKKITFQKPLIYCSLGTRSWEYKNIQSFYQNVITCFRENPGFDLVLNVGNSCDLSLFKDVPENVEICNWAPQLDMLEKCDVMITNCGLNTLRECIHYGIPILSIPVAYDQFYNANKIEQNGIGIVKQYEEVSVKALSGAINSLVKDKKYRGNVCRLREKIAEVEDFSRTLARINEIAQSKNINS